MNLFPRQPGGGIGERGPFLTTITGRAFHLLDPRPEDVCVEDVAHGLAYWACRFAGHVPRFYSTAEHAVLVSLVVPPEDAWEGVHHDDGEAYLGDWTRPLKDAFAHLENPLGIPLRQSEPAILAANVDEALAKRWRLRTPMPPSVKTADLAVLVAERRDLGLTVAGPLTRTENVKAALVHVQGLPPHRPRL